MKSPAHPGRVKPGDERRKFTSSKIRETTCITNVIVSAACSQSNCAYKSSPKDVCTPQVGHKIRSRGPASSPTLNRRVIRQPLATVGNWYIYTATYWDAGFAYYLRNLGGKYIPQMGQSTFYNLLVMRGFVTLTSDAHWAHANNTQQHPNDKRAQQRACIERMLAATGRPAEAPRPHNIRGSRAGPN